MTKYIDGFTGVEYVEEGDARDAIIERLDEDDVAEQLQYIASTNEILNELRRLESPLYFRALEAATENIIEDYLIEEEDDEDE